MASEDFYQSNVTVNLSPDEQSVLMDHCKELVIKAGGTVREDMSRFFGYIGRFTLPNGVENPIKDDDEKFKGKICTYFLG
ncbi:hypothetical protein G7Y89_g7511 [Cudoniella acicularis]|uniref:Uncharacterized protein n=1 Tax=Cudoniella acicularis TaxID=354080 RepID=A0A8H4W201_9HELO|nr:hypothetical protein G7Y89_g7511 [Cudoniella acicularis]